MKTLLRKRSLPFLLLCFVLATGCQVKEDPITDTPITTADFRDTFTGEFEFSWTHTVTRNGFSTVKAETNVGLVSKTGDSQLSIEYRPGIFRKMMVSSTGILTDIDVSSDGYSSTGSFSGTNALSLTMTNSNSSSETHLQISGVRK